MNKDLELLHQKVDFLTEQVMQSQRRQQDWLELKNDLTPIANDLLRSIIAELEQISPYFSSDDLLFLLKKVLRNTRQFITLIEQLESASDFVRDAVPISKEVFQVALQRLDELEQKGYFRFIQQTLSLLDRVVQHYAAPESPKQGDTIDALLGTVQQLTQPHMLQLVQNLLAVFEALPDQAPRKSSYWALYKQLRDPQVRQGMAVALDLLRAFSTTTVQSDRLTGDAPTQ
ncbi:MAG TPA: DUF1641 domain-containing protein [bacterium]|nr:DUF1641 domain-containing protein [bacterium]HOX85203.1 DUF1641 domain-containing protein [bacterium]HPG44362.1 DUF1641 domain-containing protein [bacterium]HPM96920.1 DUF1641 domain-containing protein [bacterium]